MERRATGARTASGCTKLRTVAAGATRIAKVVTLICMEPAVLFHLISEYHELADPGMVIFTGIEPFLADNLILLNLR